MASYDSVALSKYIGRLFKIAIQSTESRGPFEAPALCARQSKGLGDSFEIAALKLDCLVFDLAVKASEEANNGVKEEGDPTEC